MNFRNVSAKINPTSMELASYFGLRVEIMVRMRNCSLIRWHHRKFIVDTQDLMRLAELAAA